MVLIRLSLLGGYRVRRPNGEDIRLPTRKTEALLAFLACHPGEKQPRDRLTALLWGDRSDRQARHSLSQTLLSIRNCFDDPDALLLMEREAVTLRADGVESDVFAFRRLVADESDLRSALDLYRGQFLDGFSLREPVFEAWLTEERSRLHGQVFDTFLALADSQAETGNWSDAIAT